MIRKLPLECPNCNQQNLRECGHGRVGNQTGTGTVRINVLVHCVGETCDGFYGYVPFDLTVTPDCQVVEENSVMDKLLRRIV